MDSKNEKNTERDRQAALAREWDQTGWKDISLSIQLKHIIFKLKWQFFKIKLNQNKIRK